MPRGVGVNFQVFGKASAGTVEKWLTRPMFFGLLVHPPAHTHHPRRARLRVETGYLIVVETILLTSIVASIDVFGVRRRAFVSRGAAIPAPAPRWAVAVSTTRYSLETDGGASDAGPDLLLANVMDGGDGDGGGNRSQPEEPATSQQQQQPQHQRQGRKRKLPAPPQHSSSSLSRSRRSSSSSANSQGSGSGARSRQRPARCSRSAAPTGTCFRMSACCRCFEVNGVLTRQQAKAKFEGGGAGAGPVAGPGRARAPARHRLTVRGQDGLERGREERRRGGGGRGLCAPHYCSRLCTCGPLEPFCRDPPRTPASWHTRPPRKPCTPTCGPRASPPYRACTGWVYASWTGATPWCPPSPNCTAACSARWVRRRRPRQPSL
jgi:hypothetical protein